MSCHIERRVVLKYKTTKLLNTNGLKLKLSNNENYSQKSHFHKQTKLQLDMNIYKFLFYY